jgi:hypothetical protein
MTKWSSEKIKLTFQNTTIHSIVPPILSTSSVQLNSLASEFILNYEFPASVLGSTGILPKIQIFFSICIRPSSWSKITKQLIFDQLVESLLAINTMLRTCLGPLQGIFRNFRRPLHCNRRTSISTWNRYSSRGSKTDVSRFDRSNQLHPEGTTASKPRD